LASVAAWRGQPARAARLWGASEALREASGSVADSPFARFRYDHEGLLAAARATLGEPAFEEAWAEGRAMAPEQAVDYALSEEKKPASPPPEGNASVAPASLPAGLSAREAEVLKLVAKGLTNAQVAQALFISPRTINGHLGSIYAKLGISSRAAATRFALEHELA
jgi:DNA-binding NarL/FixJ family response regulator